MGRLAFLRLISVEMDPYFLVELIIIFSVFIADYSLIFLYGTQAGGSSLQVYNFTGSLLNSIYFPYVLVLSLNIFMVTIFLENGKILTFVAFGRSVRRVLTCMFLWAVLYSTVITSLIFTVNVYFFEFTESPVVFAEMVFYLASFSVLFTGAGFLIATSIRSPIVSAGSLIAFFIFISPTFFGKNADTNSLSFALTGFSHIGLYTPFSNVFVDGGILEFVIGAVLFALALMIIERRSLKPMRR
ncbi:hypothetical membrane protein [Thermoplasma acidophilum]|uniref:Hypothetical membrane protein n=1 Tax=Thermoplasma acidophilum (strain ATCC 25905 / DSM 1728 / JCM 9062 / NBRC 15155 / AMRC-C165) TaxID=273075 RepID=Q9HJE3_THEAC|nr:hypothetical membrane protein [Thermoplasma acidophilum]